MIKKRKNESKMCKCNENCCKSSGLNISEEKYLYVRDMYDHYKDLFRTALTELKFKNMGCDHLLSVLEEVVLLLKLNINNKIIADVIKNGIDRYRLDMHIHNEELFPDTKGFNQDDEDNEDDEDDEEHEDDYIEIEENLYKGEEDGYDEY